ncbi:ankyrin repeat domain-containing protein [Oscillatoria salina]|uniref:ankyrin repeat domain-containing protein n=1 Tax=Oscillatoria salina TaxID=331517 RepID=UPI0013B8376E|nr:ankyrin repeat domain-containing protein [Oscillatoria salina]MBZ8180096.1 ankyrin repeat domain-containing protein [Oscillatoria salina IIICB1]NET89309.1 ankyrin repeat domain-containing protein [Kamptonema sp. SIO1D9]
MRKPHLEDDLFDAIEEKDLEKIHALIKAGCDVNGNHGSSFEEGITFLMFATATGNLETVKLLVKLGADVNAESIYGDSALLTAALNGFPDIIEYLEPLTNPEIKVAVKRYVETGKGYPPKSKKR